MKAVNFHRLAFFLSLAAALSARLVADQVFERLPHLEDEMAYVWQAETAARGQLTIPSPPLTKSLFVPFVVDYHGLRFGKYPPGWPSLLAVGVLFGARDWVNPLLAALAVWLTYRLGQKIFDDRIALLAAFLTLTSPFFLLNSGSLLSHPWSLVLSLALALAWIDLFLPDPAPVVPSWVLTGVAGLSLGVLALTRPLTALGVGLPFFLHGLILLWCGAPQTRRRVLAIGLLTTSVAALLPLWQFAVTGSLWQNPYSLWWPYDRVGFGEGFGRQEGGHSLYWAWINLQNSLEAGRKDLFGWGRISWLFLPFGICAARRNQRAWLMTGVPLSLTAVYLTYWIGSTLYGPRYYYEGLYSLTLLTAAGIFWPTAATREPRLRRFLILLVSLLTLFLVGYNLAFYQPKRFAGMRGLYGISRRQLAPFETQTVRAAAPALFVVHPQNTWTDYGGLLELQDPWLTSPFIFAYHRSYVRDDDLQEAFPQRRIIHYYPGREEPFNPPLK